MAGKEEAIADALATAIGQITDPAPKKVWRVRPTPSRISLAQPCAFVWLEKGRAEARADNNKWWVFTLGIAEYASCAEESDVAATQALIRGSIEDKLDSDQTLGGKCSMSVAEEWQYFDSPIDDTASWCGAGCFLNCKIQITKGSN